MSIHTYIAKLLRHLKKNNSLKYGTMSNFHGWGVSVLWHPVNNAGWGGA